MLHLLFGLGIAGAVFFLSVLVFTVWFIYRVSKHILNKKPTHYSPQDLPGYMQPIRPVNPAYVPLMAPRQPMGGLDIGDSYDDSDDSDDIVDSYNDTDTDSYDIVDNVGSYDTDSYSTDYSTDSSSTYGSDSYSDSGSYGGDGY